MYRWESWGRQFARSALLVVVAALRSDRESSEDALSPERIRTEYFMGMNRMR